MKHLPILSVLSLLLFACENNIKSTKKDSPVTTADSANKVIPLPDTASAATIISRKEVPVLCYHNLREFRNGEGDRMKSYTVPPAAFAAQMQALADSGYKTVSPEEYYNYLVFGKSLPEKPVMISFDDTDLEHFTIGAAEMNKHGFKGVFFIMTISIGRPGYMSKEQLKQLADEGHTIASHTWDHHKVTAYKEEDWDVQLLKTKEKLEGITGKPVEYFAYPFGLWNQAAIPELQKRGYKAAFQLSTKQDSLAPLYTLRRMIVPGTWTTTQMFRWMKGTFNKGK